MENYAGMVVHQLVEEFNVIANVSMDSQEKIVKSPQIARVESMLYSVWIMEQLLVHMVIVDVFVQLGIVVIDASKKILAAQAQKELNVTMEEL